MASCVSPLAGYQRSAGSPLSFSPVFGARRVVVPCGQCWSCRLDRSAQYATRIMHEAQMHEFNSFVTLTYAQAPWSLVPKDLTDFWKRFRKRVGVPVRYFACGEYGDRNGRAHYHACILGYGFPDRTLWRAPSDGCPTYRSALLEGTWGLGHCELGELTQESAAYVARYCMKKQVGPNAYRQVDIVTGEIREEPFARMSLKPGLGRPWLDKFGPDVFPHGHVTLRGGIKRKTPKYYDNVFRRFVGPLRPGELTPYEQLAARRLASADGRFDDNSPSRLRVKEVVAKARISSLKRSL